MTKINKNFFIQQILANIVQIIYWTIYYFTITKPQIIINKNVQKLFKYYLAIYDLPLSPKFTPLRLACGDTERGAEELWISVGASPHAMLFRPFRAFSIADKNE